jgi:16S rRNA (guanine966-N2)-methyltransferase
LNKTLKNEIRIIGGKWRSRKLKVLRAPGLRPTPDRVRVTLFNWLAPVIHGAYCLDLFAGSGALGFEALSRGAKAVVFVDRSIHTLQQIKAQSTILNCEDDVECYYGSSESYLKQSTQKFDVVFLDPPFHKNLIPMQCKWLETRQLVKLGTYIYIEAEALKDKDIDVKARFQLPAHWEVLKVEKAGEVSYHLIKINEKV